MQGKWKKLKGKVKKAWGQLTDDDFKRESCSVSNARKER